MENERESFIFYRSFHNQLKDLDDNTRLRIYDTIVKYMFEHIIPQFQGLENAFWIGIKEILDRDKAKYDDIVQKRSEAGKRGGAPKGNQNARKKNDDVGQGDSEKIPIGFVVQKWNKVYDDSTKDDEGNFWRTLSTMHKITDFSEPISLDAQEQLNTLNCKICDYIKSHDIKEIHKRAFGTELPDRFDVNNKEHMRNMCWGVIDFAMWRLPDLRIKPKSSNFGTIQWFLKFENVIKLFNGEIS